MAVKAAKCEETTVSCEKGLRLEFIDFFIFFFFTYLPVIVAFQD